MYVTLFDRNYLLRGLAMVDSLLKQDPDAEIVILALDYESNRAVRDRYSETKCKTITLEELHDDRIWSARNDRTYTEFCWTLGAYMCNRMLRDGHSWVVYLDADIYFFGDPDIPLREMKNKSVGAVGHRFPNRLKYLAVNGRFNVEWVFFRNDEEGQLAADLWARQCLDCCKYDPENGVVGDQKYLDEWPNLFKGFQEVMHDGVGVAPWNHESYDIRLENKRWFVENDPLVFYHFHGMNTKANGHIEISGPIYSEVKELPIQLYLHYLNEMKGIWDSVQCLVPEPLPATWKITQSNTFGRRVAKRFPWLSK